MMSLPFVLFACGLGAAWLRQREVALGFWTAGLVVLLALFRAHYGDALNSRFDAGGRSCRMTCRGF